MRLNFLYILFKLRLPIIALLFLPVIGFSQSIKEGSIEYLKAANGFGPIILGSPISSIPDYKLAYLDNDRIFDADSCLKYAYKDTTILRLGHDLYFDLVGIRTYKDRIVNIYLFFKKKDGYKVLRNFLSTYGLFASKPNDYVDIYNWVTANVNLTLQYELNAELGVAVFTCNSIEREIEAMKLRRIINNYYLNKLEK